MLSHLAFVAEEEFHSCLLAGSCLYAPSSGDWLSWTAAFCGVLCLLLSNLSQVLLLLKVQLMTQHLLNHVQSLHWPQAVLFQHQQAGFQWPLIQSHHLFYYCFSSCLLHLPGWRAGALLSLVVWAHLVSCAHVLAALSRDLQNPGPSHPCLFTFPHIKRPCQHVPSYNNHPANTRQDRRRQDKTQNQSKIYYKNTEWINSVLLIITIYN